MIENMGQAERKSLVDVTLIDSLGEILFTRQKGPISRLPISPWPVVGFDTEYTSRGRKIETAAGTCRIPTLLSFQLHTGEKGGFYEIKRGETFNPVRLYQECCGLLGEASSDIYLAVYFSLAELQFLPVFTEGFRLMEYSRGSTDCSFKAGNGNLHIFDLYRWFDGQGLAKAAQALGYSKLAQDTSKMTRARNNTAKGREYALHDAWLCWRICTDLREQFLSKTGVDPLTTKTPASASAKAFRALHVKEDIYCDNDRARRAALCGLWGGRAEVFSRGPLKGTFAEYDFTSAYPTAASLIYQFPQQGSWREFTTIRQAEKLRGGFCHVRFRYDPKERYPCLGVRSRDQTIYPLRGESWCTTYEAVLASQHGADVKILEGWGYKTGTRVLKDYLDWTMEERGKSKGAARVMWKLLGNSLVGKLAQRGIHADTEAMMNLARDMGLSMDEFLIEFRSLNYEERQALGLVKSSVGPVFLPEWNGLITGFVRSKLSSLVRDMEAVYCHTDSAWIKTHDADLLQLSDEWKIPVELKGTGPCTIVRTRFGIIGQHTQRALYNRKTHLAFHSIWSRSAALKIIQRFRRDPRTFEHVYSRCRPLHFKEATLLGVPPGTWIEQERKGATYWDQKRRLVDGGGTVPWTDANEYADARKALERSKRKHKGYVDLE